MATRAVGEDKSKAVVAIGRKVEDEASALRYADELMANAKSYFDDKEESRDENTIQWQEVKRIHDVSIETAQVTGDKDIIPSRGIKIARCSIPIGGEVTAKEFYEFLISKEGCIFLDPHSDPEDFGVSRLGPFDSKNGTLKAQVELSTLNIPSGCIAKRDFVILNVFDSESRTFVSGSCFSPQICGGKSPYDDEDSSIVESGPGGSIRMAMMNTYNVSEKDGQVFLNTASFGDLNGWFPVSIANMMFPAYYTQLTERAMEKYPLK